MKITEQHFATLKAAIDAVLVKYNVNGQLVAEYENGQFARSEKVIDLQKRFCFDLLYGAGLASWVSDNLSGYLNDDHIYTALKRICPKIERKY
ncbi:hypothetical protein [Alishewanella phage vB_AspM_Slickus01]|nr:hypothetical protein [Alishewanella phage vB_AspM_Slickus01]